MMYGFNQNNETPDGGQSRRYRRRRFVWKGVEPMIPSLPEFEEYDPRYVTNKSRQRDTFGRLLPGNENSIAAYLGIDLPESWVGEARTRALTPAHQDTGPRLSLGERLMVEERRYQAVEVLDAAVAAAERDSTREEVLMDLRREVNRAETLGQLDDLGRRYLQLSGRDGEVPGLKTQLPTPPVMPHNSQIARLSSLLNAPESSRSALDLFRPWDGITRGLNLPIHKAVDNLINSSTNTNTDTTRPITDNYSVEHIAAQSIFVPMSPSSSSDSGHLAGISGPLPYPVQSKTGTISGTWSESVSSHGTLSSKIYGYLD
jgi:hypothetical protein